MRLVWTHPAHTDRKKIREYIAQDNPAAALALDALLSEKAGLLLEHPGLGRAGRVAPGAAGLASRLHRSCGGGPGEYLAATLRSSG